MSCAILWRPSTTAEQKLALAYKLGDAVQASVIGDLTRLREMYCKRRAYRRIGFVSVSLALVNLSTKFS